MEDESPLLIAPSSSWLARNDAKLRTRRSKVIVSSSYCLAMAALGCVYAAQGPATIALAEQCGIVQAPPKNSTGGKINARDLPEIGIANALDAGAGVVGGFVGGWLCDRSRRWHRVLSLYLVTQGVAFVCFTLVRNFSGLLAVSLGQLGSQRNQLLSLSLHLLQVQHLLRILLLPNDELNKVAPM